MAVIAVGSAGGMRALGHPRFLIFIALEGTLSLVEGFFSRPALRRPSRGDQPPSHQLPFILAGKTYLLARIGCQMVVLVWFARIASSITFDVGALTTIGAALMVSGVVLRVWSMATLGERFRGFEVKREPQGLETSGPYATVRHPAYLALTMIDLGVPLLLAVPRLIVLAAIPTALLVRRIQLEERLLAVAYPDSYPAYAARTWRLIPGVY